VLLLLDNYDSFTYNLRDYLIQCGAAVEVIRNDAFDVSTLHQYQGVVISPGPGIPENAGCTMEVLKSLPENMPLLGVCLGMQAIGLHYGGKLVKAGYPMHGKVSTLNFENHPLFNKVKMPLEVCRYHSLVLEALESTELSCIATSENGETMAIVHNSLPLWGVQFHPEAILTTQGMLLLENWLNYFNLR
jgi:anthranilate synthase/aminodeoxychorismate synthase-like glutamine amidotransferase